MQRVEHPFGTPSPGRHAPVGDRDPVRSRPRHIGIAIPATAQDQGRDYRPRWHAPQRCNRIDRAWSTGPVGRAVQCPKHASGQRSRRRPKCPTDPDQPQRSSEAPRRASRLTSVSIFVSTGPLVGPNRPCLQAIIGSDTRNHNSLVVGSRPSSGIREIPANRHDRQAGTMPRGVLERPLRPPGRKTRVLTPGGGPARSRRARHRRI